MPGSKDVARFRSMKIRHRFVQQAEQGRLGQIQPEDFEKLVAEDFGAEFKWDGIRVQASAGKAPGGQLKKALYSRTGEDIARAFPDLVDVLSTDMTIDGELLVLIDGRVQPFNVLQQRLNRKTVTAKMMASYPAHIRAYDLLVGEGEDLRSMPFAERRRQLEQVVADLDSTRIDISPLIPIKNWDEAATALDKPAGFGAGADADAVEGLMLKRWDSTYVPGRGSNGNGTRTVLTRC